ncbi:MAG TPA: ankyrin repeat domain-containing protein [Gammaproteobacteria bacterium]|nr:ankyrin repeat domain-containing protein [Gammaproteobacteria bacterium]
MEPTRIMQGLRLTPLMQHVFNGDIESITETRGKLSKIILEEKDTNGYTALMWAIKRKEWDIVKELVSQGANLQAVNKYHETPLILLARDNESVNICRDLEASGAINYKDLAEAGKRDQLIKIVKRTGHILGLRTKISDVDPQGLPANEGALLLQEYLYNSLPNGDLSDDSIRPFDAAILQKGNNVATHRTAILDRYRSGQCTILPIRWSSGESGHAIALIAWNDILVVCNRGNKKFAEGISVFKMQPSTAITEQWLQQMLPDDMSPSSEEVLLGIHSLVRSKPPILDFPSLEQQYGTCAFVNLKSSLQPVLFFMKLLRDKNIPMQKFDSEFLTTFTQQIDQLKKAKAESREQYKVFTKTIRDKIVQELCEKFKLSSEKERETYFAIFKAILTDHYGQDNKRGHRRSQEKKDAEVARAKIILSAMTSAEQDQVLRGMPENAAKALREMLPTLPAVLNKHLLDAINARDFKVLRHSFSKGQTSMEASRFAQSLRSCRGGIGGQQITIPHLSQLFSMKI